MTGVVRKAVVLARTLAKALILLSVAAPGAKRHSVTRTCSLSIWTIACAALITCLPTFLAPALPTAPVNGTSGAASNTALGPD